MPRHRIPRLHIPTLPATSRIRLDSAQSHHASRVLRLGVGDAVELFDDAGQVAGGKIVLIDAQSIEVERDEISDAHPARAEDPGPTIVVASAVPKGERADWMIEKLSELGVGRFVPLEAARSVVLPGGSNKRDRWLRIALESAKQSRRMGVMEIAPLTPLRAFVEETSAGQSAGMDGDANKGSGKGDAITIGGTSAGNRTATDPSTARSVPSSALVTATFILSTSPAAIAMTDAMTAKVARDRTRSLRFIIGPEGGWTDDELMWMEARGLTSVKLTATILRVETAAIAAAAVAACWMATNAPKEIPSAKER